MNNEFIFLLHILFVTLMGLGALSLGRSALITTITLQCIVANLFVTKQIILFGLNVTCTDIFIVGSQVSLNLLQEFFGIDEAKKAIRISFFFLICFLILSQFQIWYTPSQFDSMHLNYYSILSFTPRIILASILAYLTSQNISILIFKFLKKIFNNKFLALRSGITTSLSQLIDTVVFTIAALYGITYSVAQIITLSFAIKLFAIAVTTPFVTFAKMIFTQPSPSLCSWLRRARKADNNNNNNNNKIV